MLMQISASVIQTSGIRIASLVDGVERGHVFLYILRNELHPKPFGFIEDVFVVDTYRGHGVGTDLVDAAILSAKNSGCYKIILTSRNCKSEVHAWYERIGFIRHGYEFRMDLKTAP